MCIPKNTLLPGSAALAPSDPDVQSRFAPGGTPTVHWIESHGTGWPLLAAPVLGGRAVGAAPTDRSRITAPTGDGQCPDQDSNGCCRSMTSQVSRPSSASCHHPNSCWHPSIALGRRDLCFRHPPRLRSGRSETPFTDESQRHPADFRPRSAEEPPLVPRLGRRKAQLPTRFHAPYQGALDPLACRLFTRASRPRAARQLLQQSVPGTRPQTARLPPSNAASYADDEPPIVAEGRAGLSQVRGRLAFTASTPTRTTARLGGFTPT